MKKLLFVLVLLLLPAALAEPAREYAAWLEEALPGAAFVDVEVPAFCIDHLGADYDFIAREDAHYGYYIAGARRDSAPQLSEGAYVDTDGSSWNTRVWRVVDGNEEIYNFVLNDNVYLYAYDHFQHLLVLPREDGGPFAQSANDIVTAATASGRARLAYMQQRGFVNRDQSRPQLAVFAHSIETWRAGITDQPTLFYLNVEIPDDLLGARSITGDKAIALFDSEISLGTYLYQGEDSQHLVLSTSGVKALRLFNPPCLQEVGPGFDALLDQAQAALGHRPGPPDFAGKTSVRATFEWARGEDASGNAFGPGSKVIEDPNALRKLDEAFRAANFTVGSVNCPAPAFLTLEYGDGSSISLAVAVNSFDLFFHGGVCFTAGDGHDFLEMFGLQGMNFYSNLN